MMNQFRQKSFQRVKSAVGTRYSSKTSDQRLMSVGQLNDNKFQSPKAQITNKNKDLTESNSNDILSN